MIPQDTRAQHRQQRFIEFFNAGAFDIPPYGVVEIAGAETLIDRSIMHVKRPTANSLGRVMLNGPLMIPVGGTGPPGTNDYPAYALYNDATAPTVGAQWGSAAGSFLLKAGNTGFLICGDANGETVRVIRDHATSTMNQPPGGGIISLCVPACECCAIDTPGKLLLTLTGFTCCEALNAEHELCWHEDGGCRWFKCVSGFCLVEDPTICSCDNIIPVDLYINAVMPPPATGCFCSSLVVTITLSAPRFSPEGCLTANRTLMAARFIFDLPGDNEPDCCATISDAIGCYIGIACNGTITGSISAVCVEPSGSNIHCGCDEIWKYWHDGALGIHPGRIRFTFTGSATGYVVLSPVLLGIGEGCYRWEWLNEGETCSIPANCALVHCAMTMSLTCPNCDLSTMDDIVLDITGAGSETCNRSEPAVLAESACTTTGLYLRYTMTLVEAEPDGCLPCHEGDLLTVEVTNEDPFTDATCGCSDEVPASWDVELFGFLAGTYNLTPVVGCDCVWRSAWFPIPGSPPPETDCPDEWQLCLRPISIGTEITYELTLRDRTESIRRIWYHSYGTSVVCCDITGDSMDIQISENVGDCDQDFNALLPTLSAICV